MHAARRLTCLLPLLCLTLLAGCGFGEDNRGFGLVLPTDRAYLPRDAETRLEVLLIRRDYSESVRVRAIDLPPGVTSDPVDIPGDALAGTLVLVAARDAALGDHWITILASSGTEPRRSAPMRITIGPPRLGKDLSFGFEGAVLISDVDRTTGRVPEYDVCSVVAEPEGGFTVAGTLVDRGESEESWYWFLYRFVASGQRDSRFGGADSTVRRVFKTTDLTPPGHWATRMRSMIRTQAGGYLCVGGIPDDGYRHHVEYFAPDGSLDSDVGIRGSIVGSPASEPGLDAQHVIELDGNDGEGGFLVVGEIPHADFGTVMSLTRYHANLLVDDSFGTDGTLGYAFAGQASGARRVGRLSRDALVVGGWHEGRPFEGAPDNRDFALLRLLADGTPVPSGGPLRELSYDVTDRDELLDLKTNRGRTMFGGATADPMRGLLTRFGSTGRDLSFETTELLIWDTDFSALEQTWHSTYAVGTRHEADASQAFASRFDPEDGHLDRSDRTFGLYLLEFDPDAQFEQGSAVALQPGGSMIVAGTSDGRLAITRLWQ